jgi:hypothetical protein
MRRNIEQIEIKEPPIQEITKRKSCARRSCTTGLGCIVIFLVAALLLLKFAAGPNVKNLKQVPDNFPKEIPVYDKDNITKITFISGKEKNRVLEMAAFIPKLILSPIILVLDNSIETKRDVDDKGNVSIKKEADWKDWWRLMQEPIADDRDIIQIEWTGLPAEPRFIYKYYENELKKFDYEIEQISYNDEKKEFSFQLDEIEGIIYVEDITKENGTDFVSLTINIPQTE